MLLRDVEYFNFKGNLSEIYQDVNIKFAFASINKDATKIVQTHPWVKCRDFLHDAVRTQLTGIASAIYGFGFDVQKNPSIDLDFTRLLITKQNIEDPRKFRIDLGRALRVIHYYEDILGVHRSCIYKVKGDTKNKKYGHVWCFVGNKVWQSAPYMISTLSFLLRLGCKLPAKFDKTTDPTSTLVAIANDTNVKQDNDKRYLSVVGSKLTKVIRTHKKLSELTSGAVYSESLYDPKVPIGSFHDKSGIVSVCNANTWSKDLNKKSNAELK